MKFTGLHGIILVCFNSGRYMIRNSKEVPGDKHYSWAFVCSSFVWRP